jgi:Na+:H+ antiporter, NhaA family
MKIAATRTSCTFAAPFHDNAMSPAAARHSTSSVVAFILDNSLLLIAGTLTALVWTNVNAHSYEQLAHALHFAVNDVGMVFFFALATKEIAEATFPGGALESPREAVVPLIAALGGMIVPALSFVLLTTLADASELRRGWAIPCATDIAFSYMAARFIFPRTHPAIPFLLLLAIADDALGLILLAVVYPSGPLSPVTLMALMIPALGVAWALRHWHVQSFWPYVLVAGGLSWMALYMGGVHPALALVPIVPFMPHAARDLGMWDPREDSLPDTMNRFEHWWKTPVQVILFFFGLANAGVQLSDIGPVTWIVLVSLVVGKPVGIMAFTFATVSAGLRLPSGLRAADMLVVGVAAGIGFTVALFFATSAFPAGAAFGDALAEAKMGALLSFVALPVAVLLGRALKPRGGS